MCLTSTENYVIYLLLLKKKCLTKNIQINTEIKRFHVKNYYRKLNSIKQLFCLVLNKF